MMRWENRVFVFVLAVCKVNAYLARVYFRKESEIQIDFKKKLCFELITHLDDVRNTGDKSTPQRKITKSSAPSTLQISRGAMGESYQIYVSNISMYT
jgi:hypothetical protein